MPNIEHSNYLPAGTTHREIPATCPKEFRDRIAGLRASGPGSSWLEKQLEKTASVQRELVEQLTASPSMQAERPVVRQRATLSQQELLMRAELRQRLWQAERDAPYMDGAGDYDDPGSDDIDNVEFDSIKHLSWALAHMAKAAELDGSDQQHDQHKASAHYAAVAAHIQAANVYGSKDSSLLSKDAATKGAKAASKIANAD
jgi:hypothetical protein